MRETRRESLNAHRLDTERVHCDHLDASCVIDDEVLSGHRVQSASFDIRRSLQREATASRLRCGRIATPTPSQPHRSPAALALTPAASGLPEFTDVTNHVIEPGLSRSSL